MERYSVRGLDGNEYGPATLDELAAWKKQGRVANESVVRVLSTGAQLRASDLLGDGLAAPPRLPSPAPAKSTNPPWLVPALLALGACACVFPFGLALVRGVETGGAAMRGSSEYQPARRVAGALVAITRGDGRVPDLRKTAELLERLKPYVSADVLRDAATMSFHDDLSGRDLSSIDMQSTWLLRTPPRNGQVAVCYLSGSCQMMSKEQADQLDSVPVAPRSSSVEI
jgi:hypothetical protein